METLAFQCIGSTVGVNGVTGPGPAPSESSKPRYEDLLPTRVSPCIKCIAVAVAVAVALTAASCERC